MSGRVDGKKALITGAAGGLGEAMAWMLVREGAKVAICDINEASAQALAAAINADHPGSAFAYAHDAASEAAWIEVTKRANADLGGLSILIHNAGIGGDLTFMEASELDNWRKVHAVNTESIMLGTKHALPYLRENQPGSIVVLSSIAGLLAA